MNKYRKSSNVLRVNSGSFLVDSTRIIYSRYIYDNKIYEFEKNEHDKWSKTSTYTGPLGNQNPITYLASEDANSRKRDILISNIHQDDPLRMIIHNQSRGLLKYKKHILHFTVTDIQGNRVFGAEIYDNELNPLGYQPLKSIPSQMMNLTL